MLRMPPCTSAEIVVLAPVTFTVPAETIKLLIRVLLAAKVSVPAPVLFTKAPTEKLRIWAAAANSPPDAT